LKQLNFWSRKLYRRAIQLFGSHFYINPDQDPSRSILVAGAARSGTTWLGDLISSRIACRILFEPFHPHLVPEYRNFNYFQYMRPGAQNPQLHSFAEQVFRGDIRNKWIDHQNEQLFPTHRLIKEIRANLALKWLHDHFPQVPIVFLLRHPCAVVLSRMELGWATDGDIEPFLSQPELISDYLSEHVEFIRTAKTDEEKHAIIWCISNLVPLKQFQPGELTTVYYENLCCMQPEIELPTIFAAMGQRYSETAMDNFHRPSQTTRESSPVVDGIDKLTHWKRKLSPSQIASILGVVERFGLHTVYNDSLVPLNEMDPALHS
jgi:hypothetical protein